MSSDKPDNGPKWFIMRDLKRRNAKLPAYKMLEELGIEHFTPMVQKIVKVGGSLEHRTEPFIQDLLFVRETRERLDPIVEKTPTLQYRFLRGGGQNRAMTVRDSDMDTFIAAVSSCGSPRYFRPGQITPSMYGRHVRIIGGPMDGYAGRLLSARGSRTKRLIVELPQYLSVVVEVSPELIEFL